MYRKSRYAGKIVGGIGRKAQGEVLKNFAERIMRFGEWPGVHRI